MKNYTPQLSQTDPGVYRCKLQQWKVKKYLYINVWLFKPWNKLLKQVVELLLVLFEAGFVSALLRMIYMELNNFCHEPAPFYPKLAKGKCDVHRYILNTRNETPALMRSTHRKCASNKEP